MRISYGPSVLLPERFSGFPPCTFGIRCRTSPEPHPFLVPVRTRTPESFTPSADFRHSPKNFVCHYVLLRTAFQGCTIPPRVVSIKTLLFRIFLQRTTRFANRVVLLHHNSSKASTPSVDFTPTSSASVRIFLLSRREKIAQA